MCLGLRSFNCLFACLFIRLSVRLCDDVFVCVCSFVCWCGGLLGLFVCLQVCVCWYLFWGVCTLYSQRVLNRASRSLAKTSV